MASTPEIDWELSDDFARDAGDALEALFKKELSKALHMLIAEEGFNRIYFDENDNPVLEFSIDPESPPCISPLADSLATLIANYAGDLKDEIAGPIIRRQLSRLCEVMQSAADEIRMALGDPGHASRLSREWNERHFTKESE